MSANKTLNRSVEAVRHDVEYLRSNNVALLLDRLTSAVLESRPEHLEDIFRRIEDDLRSASRRRSARAPPQSPPRMARTTIAAQPGATPSRGTTEQDKFMLHGSLELISAQHTAVVDQAVSKSTGFSAQYNCGAGDVKFSLQNGVPWRFRLTSLFLDKLGRDRRSESYVKSSKGHYDYAWEHKQLPGLPKVRLVDKLSHKCELSRRCGKSIQISAKGVYDLAVAKVGEEEVKSLLWNHKGYINDWTEKFLDPLHVKSLEEIYGSGVFEVGWDEIAEFEQSTRFVTGAHLPRKFFLHLIAIVSRDDLLQYYNDRKALPLNWFRINQNDGERTLGDFLKVVERSVAEGRKGPGEDEMFGFQDLPHFVSTMNMCLTELSTQVVIFQKGYFFVGNNNQIEPVGNKEPIVFASAAGIDFCQGAAARFELSKYFVRNGWLNEKSKDHMRERVKQTYHCLFSGLQLMGVEYPTAIAMGLGIFIPAISDVQDDVKVIYHEAQFELLCQHDYGFKIYFLNPGPGTPQAKKLLATRNYNFKCAVCIHAVDGKSLAIQLSSLGKKTSFLNPSDCIAVLQGCMGYWWEVGMGERYVGEEDFAATSTAILARANVCSIWNALEDSEADIDNVLERIIHIGDSDYVTLCDEDRLAQVRASYPGEDKVWCPLPPLPNPPPEKVYQRFIRMKGLSETALMKVENVIVCCSFVHSILYFQTMIREMRKNGIRVHEVRGTAECMRKISELIGEGLGINFVITTLFISKTNMKGVLDNGHRLVKEVDRKRRELVLPLRIIVSVMDNIGSLERSSLYSEGANLVSFNLHELHFLELIEDLCATQRESDRISAVIRSNLDRKTQRVRQLLEWGANVNFATKSWYPIHFISNDVDVMRNEPELLQLLLTGLPDSPEHAEQRKALGAPRNVAVVDMPSRFTSNNSPRGSTALRVAVKSYNFEAIRVLLSFGANPRQQLSGYRTVLTDGEKEAMTKKNIPIPQEFMCAPTIDHEIYRGTPIEFSDFICRTLQNKLKGSDASSSAEKARRALATAQSIQDVLIACPVVEPTPTYIRGIRCASKTDYKCHPLVVLWVSLGPSLACSTSKIRTAVNQNSALMVSTLLCDERVVPWTHPQNGEWLQNWARLLTTTMDEVGTNQYTTGEQPLSWIQSIVIEVTEVDKLELWHFTLKTIKDHIKLRRGTANNSTWSQLCPWMKIISYAEGFPCKNIESHGDEYHPYLLKVRDSTDKSSVLINTQTNTDAEIVVAGLVKSTSDDPFGAESCPIKTLFEVVTRSITHWVFDGDDEDPHYPDRAYSAAIGHAIEQDYKKGQPYFQFDSNVRLYFKDMVERQDNDHFSSTRLVFRHPNPPFDTDLVVKGKPHLLSEITTNNCLLFIGAGFAAPAGGPSWNALLKNVITLAVERSEQQSADKAHHSPPEAPSLRQQSENVGDEEPQHQHKGKKRLENLRETIDNLLRHPDHTAYELSAQLLEDALGKNLQTFIGESLKNSIPSGSVMLAESKLLGEARYRVMATRLDYMTCIPFNCILTTNYSKELCMCPKEITDVLTLDKHAQEKSDDSRRRVLGHPGWEAFKQTLWETASCPICQAVTPLSHGPDGKGNREPAYIDIMRNLREPTTDHKRRPMKPIIQIHGSVEEPQTIVLSREGYRNLLHDRPTYRDFLKASMMTRSIMYLGFSFTDDYLNEIRSDVMAMKKYSNSKTETISYAIINDKNESHCDYYKEHEGVEILTWSTSQFGFGIMDRYMTSILTMTDLAAAVSASKVILFMPDNDAGEVSTAIERKMRMHLHLNHSNSSPVHEFMPPNYFAKFQLDDVGTLGEIESALKRKNFHQSWILLFADDTWTAMPSLHRELLNFLWHPHSQLNTQYYPTRVLVWGNAGHKICPPGCPYSLADQYESYLHARFCTSDTEMIQFMLNLGDSFRRTTLSVVGSMDRPLEVGETIVEDQSHWVYQYFAKHKGANGALPRT